MNKDNRASETEIDIVSRSRNSIISAGRLAGWKDANSKMSITSCHFINLSNGNGYAYFVLNDEGTGFDIAMHGVTLSSGCATLKESCPIWLVKALVYFGLAYKPM